MGIEFSQVQAFNEQNKGIYDIAERTAAALQFFGVNSKNAITKSRQKQIGIFEPMSYEEMQAKQRTAELKRSARFNKCGFIDEGTGFE